MEKKLSLAYDVINEFMQWFMYHNFALDDEINKKMNAFFEYEVKNES